MDAQIQGPSNRNRKKSKPPPKNSKSNANRRQPPSSFPGPYESPLSGFSTTPAGGLTHLPIRAATDPRADSRLPMPEFVLGGWPGFPSSDPQAASTNSWSQRPTPENSPSNQPKQQKPSSKQKRNSRQAKVDNIPTPVTNLQRSSPQYELPQHGGVMLTPLRTSAPLGSAQGDSPKKPSPKKDAYWQNPALSMVGASAMPSGFWGHIEYSDSYAEELYSLIPPPKMLEREGFVLRNLSADELQCKKKCSLCNKIVWKYQRPDRKPAEKPKPKPKETDLQKTNSQGTSGSDKIIGLAVRASNSNVGKEEPPVQPTQKEILRCQYHFGYVQQKQWTCCNTHVALPGCVRVKDHVPIQYAPGQLEGEWQYFETPAPKSQKASMACPAVAIDCEMGTSTTGGSELIRVSMLDYFSGETLLDKLVVPDVPMQHYNTRFSGVTPRMMQEARRRGTCLWGTAAARDAVWQFVSPQTVVIGHSVHNDLKALRWIHTEIVDSFMLEPKPEPKPGPEAKPKVEAAKEKDEDPRNFGESSPGDQKASVGTSATTNANGGQDAKQPESAPKPPRRKGDGPRSLRTLARVKLGRVIQGPDTLGHDSVEDALASRDLVHWAVMDLRRKAEEAHLVLAMAGATV